VIRAQAEPVLLYHNMLAGREPLDFDRAKDELARARAMIGAHLASRSLAFRVLSHRFVGTDEIADSHDGGPDDRLAA
jgi:hypothetical protein